MSSLDELKAYWLGEFFAAWHRVFGSRPVTTLQAIEAAHEPAPPAADGADRPFEARLVNGDIAWSMANLGIFTFGSRALGRWLGRHLHDEANGFMLRLGAYRNGRAMWSVVKIDSTSEIERELGAP